MANFPCRNLVPQHPTRGRFSGSECRWSLVELGHGATTAPVPVGDLDAPAEVLAFARHRWAVADRAEAELLRAAVVWAAQHPAESLEAAEVFRSSGHAGGFGDSAVPVAGPGRSVAAYAAGVRNLPLPQRVTRAVGESPLSERIARAQEILYGPVIDWARRSPLHTDALGHSMHPLLTDLTLGCWMSASILDLAGGTQARGAATLLAGAGVAMAGPTALAGTGDWAGMSGTERRIGAVHALGTDIATFLFVGSFIARVRGRNLAGTRLGLAGNLVVAGAGFLGGHLALNRGTARRAPADHAVGMGR